nr:calcium-binding protein [Sedimenticola hydrogenitrophicus]
MVTATTAGASKRIVFGGDGNDPLTQGGDKEDHLYGGKGDDLLEGKGGADYLEGGKGHDTYRAGDGDTLFDIDDNGQVLFEGKPLKGGTRQNDGSYQSADGVFTYQLADGTLTVIDGNKTLTINDFTSGDLGITLDDAAPEPGDTTHTILGDRLWKDFDTDEPGIQVQYDALGNKVLDEGDIEAHDQEDTLYDSTGNDLIQSGGGEDFINAWRGGDDHIQAGTGQDKVYAGDGHDLIEGGADTDILAGNAGNDRLYADAEIEPGAFLASDTGQTTNTRDWLSGGAGDDLLVGSHGDDGLAGGTDNDLILGGAGDDNILGDSDYTAQAFDWTYTDTDDGRVFSPVSGVTNPPDGGADVIHAGTGNDHVWAGVGDDVVFGGSLRLRQAA